MLAPPRALLDANVIYPLYLRDVLLWSAAANHYQVFWSAQILEEATRNMVADSLMSQGKAQILIDRMNRAFPSALVQGYETLVSVMTNQRKDRHVAAAALHAGVQIIVTQNLRDFRELPDGMEAQHPDEFLCGLFEHFSHTMLGHLDLQVSMHERWPKTLDELMSALTPAVPEFVRTARKTWSEKH